MNNTLTDSFLRANLESNLEYIDKIDSKLFATLEKAKINVGFESISKDEYLSYTYESNIVFDSIEALREDIALNSTLNRKISAVRVKSNTAHIFDIQSLDQLIVDKHDSEILDYLPCFSGSDVLQSSKIRDLLFIGSLQALPFCNSLETDKESSALTNPADDIDELLSLTIVESNISHLLLFLSLINLAHFVKELKTYNIQLNFVIAPTYQEIKIRLFDFYTKSAMTALLGLKVFTFPYLDNELRRVESWMFSQAGLGFSILGSLGSFTDELNQISQHLKNTTQSHYLLRKVNEKFRGLNCIVTGSGPSLDNSLDHIRQLCDTGSILIAGGSSIKSLLKHNILPDILVLLERGSEVFDILSEICLDFPVLSKVTLIASSTTDPRLSSLFNDVVYFNRPLSSSLIFNYDDQIAALPIAGPESANAALEVAGSLGFNNIMLFGLDFSTPDKLYTRSKDAYDHTPREYDVPQKGNKGRTVYSQDSLISARDSIEKAIQCFPSSSFQRFGEGLVISNLEEIDNIEKSIEYHKKYSKTELYSDFKENFMHGNLYIDEDVTSLLSKLDDQIMLIGECLLDPSSLLSLDISNIDRLHASSAVFFNSATDLNSDYSFCSRLLRQPIFYMLSYVYDSNKASYLHKAMTFNTSLQLLLLYSYSFFKRISKYLKSADSCEPWNPSAFTIYF